MFKIKYTYWIFVMGVFVGMISEALKTNYNFLFSFVPILIGILMYFVIERIEIENKIKRKE